MLGRYKHVLGLPGAARFSASGAFMRAPMAMMGISLVVGYSRMTGRYDLAGLIAAVYLLSASIAAPQIARYVDRLGQRRVVTPLLLGHALCVTGMILGFVFDWPLALLLILAVACGATYGSMGPLVRARWLATIKRHEDDLRDPKGAVDTAFAFESMVDEAVFVVGPVIVVAVASWVHPASGMAISAASAVVGGLIFVAGQNTEPSPKPVQVGDHRGSLLPRIWALLGVSLALGAIFGSLEISVVAVSEAQGRAQYAGVTLACFAFGSLISAGIYGTIPWSTWPAITRLVAALTVMVPLVMILPLVDETLFLAPAGFAMGLSISPAIIALYAVVTVVIPDERMTEGIAWNNMAMGLGLAGGTAGVGVLIENQGATWGFVTTAGLALSAVSLGTVALFRHRKREAPATHP